jgi:transcriptional regulator with XRE-family HTH domain
MTPAALLRSARREAELTQAELAARLGMTQAAVARLERPGANPTVRTLQRVLLAAGHQLDIGARPQRSSVDETLIASNLRRSPEERLRNFQSSHASVARLRELAREARGEPAGS